MRVGKHLEHVLKTKGALHSLERSIQILYRFSRGRRNFDRMIDRLESDFSGTSITFCSAASLLAEHHDAFERLARAGHELAAHGFFHSRMDYLDYDGQAQILEDSHRAFEKAGFEITGFRCPYLNFNDDTISALQSSPYDWTSQEIVFWHNGHHPATERLKELYHTRKAAEKISVPFQRGRLLEIPITAPDDEMLIERMRVRSDSEIEKIWKKTFMEVYHRGELCHLLFHPERFFEIAAALKAVVALAREPEHAVWFATIGDVCNWWRERQKVSWSRQPTESGRGIRIHAKLPASAKMLLKDPSAKPADRFYRDYVSADALRKGENGNCVFESDWGKDPTIWVSEKCPDWLPGFLVSEGFLVTRSREAGSQALQIHPDTLGAETNRRTILEKIESCRLPLLRIWRWPGDAKAALTISSDVDSITLIDFWRRVVHF